MQNLAKNLQICYTYDVLSRVVERASTNLADGTVTKQSYSYDAAGNILSNNDATYVYDTNNRLTAYNEQIIVYDADGNMSSAKLGGTYITLAYDSANRLVSTGECTYTYNAEDTRIRNISGDYDNIYVYNTNAKLSQLLVKITNGIVTKYVYGRGLIGEETEGVFKTYHFDYRGSTVAITDASGNITDTFAYDTYGRLSERTGDSTVIFGYNGRDGVVTDANGLIYMRARYYSPELHRFVNADIVKGSISNAVTLNRYAYANGNPASNIDPLGLSAERGVYTYSPYEGVILKALGNAQDSISSYYRTAKDSYGVKGMFIDALTKTSQSITNGTLVEPFCEDVKVKIELNPYYNTSLDELIMEILGFIPWVGEIGAMVDYFSEEDSDTKKIFDLIVSTVTEPDISKLTSITEELDSIGAVVDAIGAINAIETILNWNSPEKIGTEIDIFVQYKQGASYNYGVVANSEGGFKEMYSGYTGTVIKTEENDLQIIVK